MTKGRTAASITGIAVYAFGALVLIIRALERGVLTDVWKDILLSVGAIWVLGGELYIRRSTSATIKMPLLTLTALVFWAFGLELIGLIVILLIPIAFILLNRGGPVFGPLRRPK